MRMRFSRRDRALTRSSYSAGMAFSLASFASIGIITLVTSVLSARIYGISVIGQSALVLAPIALVGLLSTVREQPAMVRELAKLEPRHPRATGIFLAVFSFSFALTAVVSALGIVACYYAFNGPLHQPDLVAPAAVTLVGYLLLINTGWNVDGVLSAFRAGRELFAVRLHQVVMYGVLLVAASLLTHSVWGIVWATLGSYFTALIHRALILRRILLLRAPVAEIRAGFATLREIVGFGLRVTPGSLAVGLTESSGTWILGATSSIQAVGAYSRAWTFATRLVELNWRITEMLLPTLVERRHAGDTEGFDRVLRDSLRYAAFGMLLPAAVGGGAADGIMSLFGAGFDTAATALRLLLFVPLLQTLTAIQGAALMAHDRPLLTAIAGIVRLGVTVVAGIMLSLAFGMNGMAVAMAGGALVSFCVYLIVLRVRMGSVMPAVLQPRLIAGLLAAYCGGFGISLLIQSALNGPVGLVASLVTGSGVYLALGIVIGGTTDHDRTRLRSGISRITGDRAPTARMSGAA